MSQYEGAYRAIFQAAIAEQRCAELFDALCNGGAATVDARTHRLVVIPADALATITGGER